MFSYSIFMQCGICVFGSLLQPLGLVAPVTWSTLTAVRSINPRLTGTRAVNRVTRLNQLPLLHHNHTHGNQCRYQSQMPHPKKKCIIINLRDETIAKGKTYEQTYLTVVTVGSHHTRLTVALPRVRVTTFNATRRTVASWVIQVGNKAIMRALWKQEIPSRLDFFFFKCVLRVQFLAVMAFPVENQGRRSHSAARRSCACSSDTRLSKGGSRWIACWGPSFHCSYTAGMCCQSPLGFHSILVHICIRKKNRVIFIDISFF